MADSGSDCNPYIYNWSTSREQSTSRILNNPSFNRTQSVKGSNNLIPTGYSIKGKVKQLCRFFESSKFTDNQLPQEQKKDKLSTICLLDSRLSYTKSASSSPLQLAGTEDRIVVYFTSLRGIRRTFEDCYTVLMILRLFRVWIDERDVSMDAAYRKDFECVMGERHPTLPQVFVGGKHVGGAEVVKQLHESGELTKILRGFPVRELGYFCKACGEARFVPCTDCNGSRKIFEEEEGVIQRCLKCNENGLIHCSLCLRT